MRLKNATSVTIPRTIDAVAIYFDHFISCNAETRSPLRQMHLANELMTTAANPCGVSHSSVQVQRVTSLNLGTTSLHRLQAEYHDEETGVQMSNPLQY